MGQISVVRASRRRCWRRHGYSGGGITPDCVSNAGSLLAAGIDLWHRRQGCRYPLASSVNNMTLQNLHKCRDAYGLGILETITFPK